ncbi:MAG: TA system VapC family ribonuclease toxin [Dermatophilaceae bacterium]
MSIFLLDANVLIALTMEEHEHHETANRWIAGVDGFAVSPVVEGALVRFVVRAGERPATAQDLLREVRALPGCELWADDLHYVDVDLADVQGHRQVTDSYLVVLAQAHRARLATFDRALARRRPQTCLLVGG